MDEFVASVYRSRVSRPVPVDILIKAWNSDDPLNRAAMNLALGDERRAAVVGGKPWELFLKNEYSNVLDLVQEEQGAPFRHLEAECFLRIGAIVAGINILNNLHAAGAPFGTLALTRQLFALGDFGNCERVAKSMRDHISVAIIGARCAIENKRFNTAMEIIEPYLGGIGEFQDTMAAGSLAVMAAHALAEMGRYPQLARFAGNLISTPDMPPQLMPAIAKIAWLGGFRDEAWKIFEGLDLEWASSAKVELSILEGDFDKAVTHQRNSAKRGTPSLSGMVFIAPSSLKGDEKVYKETFAEGQKVHIWRTAGDRWSPWIEAVKQSPADVSVYSLPEKNIPEESDIPYLGLDDASLFAIVKPIVVEEKLPENASVFMDYILCRGAGVGFDWPPGERKIIEESLDLVSPDQAGIYILRGNSSCFSRLMSGLPTIIIAPPGDPFWAGPIPNGIWKNCYLIRADNEKGWENGSEKVLNAVKDIKSRIT